LNTILKTKKNLAMKRFLTLATVAAVSLFAMLTARGAEETNTPVVVCLGDSITHAGYPEELAKILPIHAINAGVNGNTSRQGLARLDKDVLKHKPAVVVVLFGTNDTRKDAPKIQVPLEEYMQNLGTIIDTCRGIGAKVVLGTIPPIDSKPYFTRHVKKDYEAAGGLENLLAQYRNAALQVGKSKNVPVVDLNQLLASDTTWRRDDGVHPTAEGNRLIAALFSKQLESMLGLKPREKRP
jgi:lysophospholipase L1-like esterase